MIKVKSMTIDTLMDCYDPITIEGYCKQCPKYEKYWSCPSFSFDTEAWHRSYKYFSVIVASTKTTHHDDTMMMFDTFRESFRNGLMTLESKFNGYSLYAGSCLLCKTCTREKGEVCRYPDEMRYSLEALGISVSHLIASSVGEKLTWGKDGTLKTVMGFLSNEVISEEEIVRIMEA